MSAKVLTLDIETSPNLADVWGLWQQNVGLSQLRETTRVICFAAKWRGDPKVEFRSDFHDGHDEMVARAWQLLDEADAVVHYNGKRFDMPHLHREFLLAGAPPPSPVIQIDLLHVVRAKFRFSSNKLDHVASQLGIGNKVHHSGHELWVKCLAGDRKAWAEMRKYNKHDVVLTEQLYDRLVPWTPGHLNAGLFDKSGMNVCPRCGSANLQKRGLAPTTVAFYQRFRCNDCGGWSRGKSAVDRVELRGIQ